MIDSSCKRVLLCLVVEAFHQFFLGFSEILLGCMSFRHNLKCDVLDLSYLLIFLTRFSEYCIL